jgi:hypothetical protein
LRDRDHHLLAVMGANRTLPALSMDNALLSIAIFVQIFLSIRRLSPGLVHDDGEVGGMAGFCILVIAVGTTAS